MKIKCRCGTWMSDVGAPNDTENLLISYRSMEKLQDLVDGQVEKDGVIDEWPEHWEKCGAIDVWKCHACNRLYMSPKSHPEQITVYAIEGIGLE